MNNTESPVYQILIVEDDKIISKIHQLRIKKLTSIECMACFNGKEALEYLDKRKKNRKTLVLLDINMPVMNGWEFLESCQSKDYRSDLIVVIVTSSLFEKDREKAERYELVKGYYSKPLTSRNISGFLPSDGNG